MCCQAGVDGKVGQPPRAGSWHGFLQKKKTVVGARGAPAKSHTSLPPSQREKDSRRLTFGVPPRWSRLPCMYVLVKIAAWLGVDLCTPTVLNLPRSPAHDDGVLDLRSKKKNWAQSFCRRHPELQKNQATRLGLGMMWKKRWMGFTILIGRGAFTTPTILAEKCLRHGRNRNTVRLSHLSKVCGPKRRYAKNIEVQGSSASWWRRFELHFCEPGGLFPPLIVWPSSNHHSDWTIHSTLGRHFACDPGGYSNSAIVFE